MHLVGRSFDQRAYERLELGAETARVVAQERRRGVVRAANLLAATLERRPSLAGAALQVELSRARDVDSLGLVVVADREGQVIASTVAEPRFATGARPPTEYEVVSKPGRPTLLASRSPVRGPQGDVIGSVTTGVWVDDAFLEDLGRNTGVSFAVADAGVVVASSGLRPPAVPDAPRSKGSAGGRDAYLVNSPGLGGAGQLVVSIPRSALITVRSTVLWLLLGGLLAVVAIVVAIGDAVIVRVTGPIRSMAAAALRVAGGDLDQRVEADGSREADELSAAFNTMTDNLRRYVRELEQSRVDFNRALERLGGALAATHDRAAIVEVVVETSALTMRECSSVFYAANLGRRQLEARSSYGLDDAALANLPIGTGVAGWAADRRTVVISPGTGMPAPAPQEPAAETAMAAPVASADGIYGVLALYGDAGRRPFSRDDGSALQALALQAGAAIENVFLHEEAKRLSITDGLTSIWNRRQFELRCRDEHQRALRFGKPFGIVMFDLDHFKLVNDTYGHQCGDAVLVELARRITNVIREVDVFARYGGEEFVLLLPENDLDGSLALAEKVRRAVGGSAFDVPGGPLTVTVSAGAASYPLHGSTPKDVVAAADTALYRAKESGRDRVEAATEFVRELL